MAKIDCDCSGWATKANLKCGDGQTIMPGAFKDCDGMTVPVCWGHIHDDPMRVLGRALLEHKDDGTYAYIDFNNTEQGRNAKELVQHGDVCSLSICANNLVRKGSSIADGVIREVSLVLSGMNPGAYIDTVLDHGEGSEGEVIIYTGEELELYHADSIDDGKTDDGKTDEGETVKEVLETLTEKQMKAVEVLVGTAIEEAAGKDDSGNSGKEGKEINHSEGGENHMKFNVFEKDKDGGEAVLTHSAEMEIIGMAKDNTVGSLQKAMKLYYEDNKDTLKHGFKDYGQLFPEYELLDKGEPELLERDQSWIAAAMRKIRKSPISRIRTRQADARIAELRAKGYQKKGDEKTITGQIKLLSRTTDPQTVYIKDTMHRDDIVDITDFDVVAYQWRYMRHVLDEELAQAALIGDGRDDGDADKIHEDHIRSIWNDAELYTMHVDVDLEAAKTKLQGTNTGANFGENYIMTEAIIEAALYAREDFKGTGTPDLYCTPHMVNQMLLARDLNGRRIYNSRTDLAAALNVNEIHTVEQFVGKTRTDANGNTKKLLGLFVNLADYTFGSTRGGEVTRFEDFDMDFNQYKYMLETRLSGGLTRVQSAIALEEPVTTAG